MRTAVATTGKSGWRAAGLLALLLCACGTAESPSPPARLQFGMDLWAGYFPAAIADHQGLMAAEGVALDITVARDTRSLIARFAAGDYDIIGVSLGDALTLTHARPDVIVLVVTNESAGGDQVLRGPNAPPLGARPAKPVRVGTAMAGFGELFLQTWMAAENLEPAQVLWSNVDASDVPKALIEGRIDYGHTWEPYASDAVAAGATRVFSSAETPGLILDVLLTTRERVEQEPEAFRAFLRAWFAADQQWRNDPDAGSAAAAARLGLAPTQVSLDGIRRFALEDNQRVMAGGADAPLASLLRRYADFFVERGSLSTPPDPAAMFDPTLLPDATPPP